MATLKYRNWQFVGLMLLGLGLASACTAPQAPQTEASATPAPQAGGTPAVVETGAPQVADSEISPRVTLATWNLENFFDAVDDPYNDEIVSAREYAEKLGGLSSVLQEVNADIVSVSEVEKGESLAELGRRSGYSYSLVVPGNDRYRGIQVGILSKIPLGPHVSHAKDKLQTEAGKETAFSRDCLEVHFKHPSQLTVLANHFKSKRGGAKSDAQRWAQAKRVREIAQGLANYPLAICGDLNEEPQNKPLQPLLSAPFLTDVLGHMPLEQRRTFFNERYQSALDYIIINDKLKPFLVTGSAKIYSNIPNIERISDHRPVKVEFDFSALPAFAAPSAVESAQEDAAAAAGAAPGIPANPAP